jgi:hypothetical protein
MITVLSESNNELLCSRCGAYFFLGDIHECPFVEPDIRDRFAMAAMAGFISSADRQTRLVGELAEDAYIMADAMMKARNGR